MEATTANRLFCIEYGASQRHNLFRMTSSVIVSANTPDYALTYVESHCPDIPTKAAVHLIFPVSHIVVNWPRGECEIVEQGRTETLLPKM
jgi:hypothetical protein